MDSKELTHMLVKQIEEMHHLLKENNLLLKEVIEQNQLIFEITQINIKSYSRYYPSYQTVEWESKESRTLREQLDFLWLVAGLKTQPLLLNYRKELRDFSAQVTYDPEAKIFHGEVTEIKDVITFQGHNYSEVKKAFQDSINDYLNWSKK